jgi:hypothetical protein
MNQKKIEINIFKIQMVHLMNHNQYLIFDIVCDYLKVKGLQTCLSFRLVSNECKILSTKLFNSHYSAYNINKNFIRSGYDEWFIELCGESMTKIDHFDYIKWISADCSMIYHFCYNDIVVNKPSDPFDPIKNALTYKGKTIIRFWRRNSIMFSLALDWAARPSYRLKYRELQTM